MRLYFGAEVWGFGLLSATAFGARCVYDKLRMINDGLQIGLAQ